jgi:hypothetical protein
MSVQPFPCGNENEGKVLLESFTPAALRNYALWWRKRWGQPFSCAGYKDAPKIVQDFSCKIPDSWGEYARGYAKQRKSYDVTPADRRISVNPSAALKKYLVGVETCMQAGKSWKECEQTGDLISLRNNALEQGVSQNTLDASLGFLGKPAEKEALWQGIASSCQVHTGGSPVCEYIADAVTGAALEKASWLLTASGQAMQDRLQALTVAADPNLQGTDPQELSEQSVAVLQAAWNNSVSALQSAWTSTRQQMGLAPSQLDVATPLMKFLLENGWSTSDSNAWTHAGAKVWLIGTKFNPMSIDPGSSDHNTWPWAAGRQKWEQVLCDSSCQIRVREGLFTLYSLLRIEPLQHALQQGLRDIAVMIADEVVASSSMAR